MSNYLLSVKLFHFVCYVLISGMSLVQQIKEWSDIPESCLQFTVRFVHFFNKNKLYKNNEAEIDIIIRMNQEHFE